MRPLTHTEASRVLDASTPRPAAQRLALRLLLEYRVTAHEICRLTVDYVDGSVLTVEDKRGEFSEIELRGPARVDLDEVLRDHRGGRLLTGRTGPLRPDALRRLLQSASAAAGIEGEISVHRNGRPADVRA